MAAMIKASNGKFARKIVVVTGGAQGIGRAIETRALHPLGRRGVPEDVAGAALFLADAASSFITGAHLVIEGALMIRAHP